MYAQLELVPVEASSNTMSNASSLLPDVNSLPVLHEADWEFQRTLMQEFHRRHVQAVPRVVPELPQAS